MSTFVERLIESWLDNQTERRYQPAFIQLLVSEGWTVLHNTRHTDLEFGKDVVARDKDGLLHCFQLKGNPNSRVTKSEAQGLIPQLTELIDIPLTTAFKVKSGETYKAVLVTNGEVDEAARVLLLALGRRAENPNAPASDFDIWNRGELIARFSKSAGKVWPTSVAGVRAVLNVFASDGRSMPDLDRITAILRETAPNPQKGLSAAERSSKLSAMLLLTEIVKSPWYQSENHYALYQLTVVSCVYALQFCDTAARIKRVQQYAAIALEHCRSLMVEADTKGFDADEMWTQGDILGDFDIQWERRRLVGDCAASLILSGIPRDQFDDAYVGRVLDSTFAKGEPWGYGAVPSQIQKYWAICKIQAGNKAERRFGNFIGEIVGKSASNLDKRPLPAPYYKFEDVWAYKNDQHFFADTDQSIFDDSFKSRAWFAMPMVCMLAKRNFKQTCKGLWGLLTAVNHEDVSLEKAVFFSVERSRLGKITTRVLPRTEWTDLIAEALDTTEGAFLDPYKDLAWLIAAYIAIVPYRAWSGVILWLDSHLGYTWYTKS